MVLPHHMDLMFPFLFLCLTTNFLRQSKCWWLFWTAAGATIAAYHPLHLNTRDNKAFTRGVHKDASHPHKDNDTIKQTLIAKWRAHRQEVKQLWLIISPGLSQPTPLLAPGLTCPVDQHLPQLLLVAGMYEVKNTVASQVKLGGRGDTEEGWCQASLSSL